MGLSHDKQKNTFSAESVISGPTDFKRNIHVKFDADKGFVGLPDEWKKLLDDSKLDQKDIIENADVVGNALKFCR